MILELHTSSPERLLNALKIDYKHPNYLDKLIKLNEENEVELKEILEFHKVIANSNEHKKLNHEESELLYRIKTFLNLSETIIYSTFNEKQIILEILY